MFDKSGVRNSPRTTFLGQKDDVGRECANWFKKYGSSGELLSKTAQLIY
jgi:hypothetical protein